MPDSPNLILPYILASQAQKHVTHNEAIRLLDGMVQLGVISRGLTAPPGSPVDGARYIVGSGATGLWAGWDLNVAFWVDGAWMRLIPRAGWISWSQADSAFYSWTGAAWVAFGGPTFTDDAFALRDNIDPTRQAAFELSGITTGTTRTLAVPDASGTIALLSGTQTFSGATTFSATFTHSSSAGSYGTSTAAATYGLGSGATINGATKAINIGTAGVSGSITNIALGSAVAGALGSLVINSPTVTFASSVSAIAMAAANVSALYLGLGGATADATNRLSVSAPATLLNNAGAGHQLKINKAAAADTASLLFQTGFSGRAEMGTTGSDDFAIKVSPDGSSFFDGLVVDRTSGRLRAMNGLGLAPAAGAPGSPTNGDLWYDSTLGRFRARQAGVSVDVVGPTAGLSIALAARVFMN